MMEPIGLAGIVILVVAFFFYAIDRMTLFAWGNLLATMLLLIHAVTIDDTVFIVSSSLIIIFLSIGMWRKNTISE